MLRYLGDGEPKKARRSERQIREAIYTLKESGDYDDIVDAALPSAACGRHSFNIVAVRATKLYRCRHTQRYGDPPWAADRLARWR
jgi:hypothetical protein